MVSKNRGMEIVHRASMPMRGLGDPDIVRAPQLSELDSHMPSLIFLVCVMRSDPLCTKSLSTATVVAMLVNPPSSLMEPKRGVCGTARIIPYGNRHRYARPRTHKSHLFGNRWLPQTMCTEFLDGNSSTGSTSRAARRKKPPRRPPMCHAPSARISWPSRSGMSQTVSAAGCRDPPRPMTLRRLSRSGGHSTMPSARGCVTPLSRAPMSPPRPMNLSSLRKVLVLTLPQLYRATIGVGPTRPGGERGRSTPRRRPCRISARRERYRVQWTHASARRPRWQPGLRPAA
jgi:hypothetical protein